MGTLERALPGWPSLDLYVTSRTVALVHVDFVVGYRLVHDADKAPTRRCSPWNCDEEAWAGVSGSPSYLSAVFS